MNILSNRYLKILSIICFFKALFVVMIMYLSDIGLSPDEAQYWTWSKKLDFGYYSKPPGIAWAIAFGTTVFGDNLIGVRISSLLFGALLPFITYFTAKSANLSSVTCFWAAVFCALSPLGFLASTLAITDVGMIFFWSLALYFVGKGFEKDQTPNYFFIGLTIGFAALFKWSAFLFLGMIVLMMPLFPILRSFRFFTAFGIALCALIPSLYWNYQHDFVTFKHVFSSIQGSKAIAQQTKTQGNMLEFIGAQFALISPFLGVFTAVAFWNIKKKKETLEPFLLFLSLVSLFSFSLLLFLSFNKKVQGNWADFAYPSAFVIVAWYLLEEKRKKTWAYLSIGSSLSLMVYIFLIPFFQSHSIAVPTAISYNLNPFRHNVGWNNLSSTIDFLDIDPKKSFIFSSKYQTTSILSFYNPEKVRAHFLNLFGARNNQFSYWKGLEQEKEKDGYFIITENEPHLSKHKAMIEGYVDVLMPFFGEVEYLGSYPLFKSFEEDVKEALIFKCKCYNGLEPNRVDLY